MFITNKIIFYFDEFYCNLIWKKLSIIVFIIKKGKISVKIVILQIFLFFQSCVGIAYFGKVSQHRYLEQVLFNN